MADDAVGPKYDPENPDDYLKQLGIPGGDDESALMAEFGRTQKVVSDKQAESKTLADIAAKRAAQVGQVGSAYDQQLQSSLGDIRASAAQGLAAAQGAGARGASLYGSMLQDAAEAGRASAKSRADIGSARQQAILGAQGQAQEAQLAASQGATAADVAAMQAGDWSTAVQQDLSNVDKIVAEAQSYAKAQDAWNKTRGDLNIIAADYIRSHLGEIKSKAGREKANNFIAQLIGG